MKRVRKRMMRRSKMLVMNPFDVHHLVQRANRIDTPTLIIQMLCNATQRSLPIPIHTIPHFPPNPLTSPLRLYRLLHHHSLPLFLSLPFPPLHHPPLPPPLLPPPLPPIPLLPLLPRQNSRPILHPAPPRRYDLIHNMIDMPRHPPFINDFHNVAGSEGGCGVGDEVGGVPEEMLRWRVSWVG